MRITWSIYVHKQTGKMYKAGRLYQESELRGKIFDDGDFVLMPFKGADLIGWHSEDFHKEFRSSIPEDMNQPAYRDYLKRFDSQPLWAQLWLKVRGLIRRRINNES